MSFSLVMGVFIIESLVIYSKQIYYAVIASTILLSAFSIYQLGQALGENKPIYILKKNLYKTWKYHIKKRYQDRELERLFKLAGNPFYLTEVSFKFIRDIFMLLMMINLHSKWILLGGNYPLWKVLWLIAIYIALLTKKGFPIPRLLQYLKVSLDAKKNREIYMLYTMLLNEYSLDERNTNNVYSILRKYKHYFPRLKDSFNLVFQYWRRNPKLALDLFAREVGTDPAKDLSKILLNIDQLSQKEAYILLENRYDHFNNLRLQEFRRKNKDRGLIGYFVTFAPTLSIVFNFAYIHYLEYKEILKLLNM